MKCSPEMTETSVIWLRVAAALYSIGLVDSIFLLTRQREPFFRTALGAFWLGGLFHLVSMVELGLIQHQFPVTDTYQRLSLCAFLITGKLSPFATRRSQLRSQTCPSPKKNAGKMPALPKNFPLP